MGQRHVPVCTFQHAQRAAYRTAISAAQILVIFYENYVDTTTLYTGTMSPFKYCYFLYTKTYKESEPIYISRECTFLQNIVTAVAINDTLITLRLVTALRLLKV